jgi:DUF4097 and DUF4098 domain-containing protein YvlB
MALKTPARTVALLVVSGVALAALPGCMSGVPNRLEFSDTEKVKITEIVVGRGGSGDVTVRTAAINETRIKRVVQYRDAEPGSTYRLDGTVLHIDTDCGSTCSVSYDIEAPAGVSVRGTLSSGNVSLTDVATADVAVSSGDVDVSRATGAVKVKATSGNITVTDLPGTVQLIATSGDIRGRGLGSGAVTVEATSGNVVLDLAKAGSVTARASSGDVTVRVPTGRYRVLTKVDSGDENVSVTGDPSATNVLDLSASSGDLSLSAV